MNRMNKRIETLERQSSVGRREKIIRLWRGLMIDRDPSQIVRDEDRFSLLELQEIVDEEPYEATT
jgi:hypothetical protein